MDSDNIGGNMPSIDGLADPVFVIDSLGILRYASSRTTEVLGWDQSLVGTSPLHLIHPDDVNLVAAALRTVPTKPYGELLRIRVRHQDGHWVHIELRGAAQIIDGEQLITITARDVTNRHALDLDRGNVEILRSVMNNMHAMVSLMGADGRIRSVNGAIARLLGHDPELMVNRSFLDYVHPEDREQVLEAVRTLAPDTSVYFDARLSTDDDSYRVCEITVNNLLGDPSVESYIVSAQIATSLIEARNRVDFLAEHDSRTGLLNRDGFMRAATELVQAGGGFGLMIIDIVHFRSINELYGEPVGDAVLTTVAERIDQIRWPELLTARFGGDEFVMAVRSNNQAAIEMLRERIRRVVAKPVQVDEHEVHLAIRTATAFEPQPQGLDSLLVSASNELMSIKRHADPESGGISFDAINERRVQLDQLRLALTNGEIQPFFQPIVDSTGRVRAVEALVRWVHPVRGVLGVSEILPLAQMAGLAEAVDDRVLELALEFARRLEQAGHHDIEVHVNVNPKMMSLPSFGHSFLSRCEAAGACPKQMVVEITETDLLAPGATSLANMERVRHAGTQVSIDDFGTGYSSLAHLLELPVDGVKIDRRFVAGIDIDRAATNLTTAILGLSDSLRLSCVAEGVEQPYQLDRLAALGCELFQGWLFAPATEADELLTMLPNLMPTVDEAAPRPVPMT